MEGGKVIELGAEEVGMAAAHFEQDNLFMGPFILSKWAEEAGYNEDEAKAIGEELRDGDYRVGRSYIDTV